MTIADWLMILVVLTGPVVAVRLTRHLDNKKEIKERKLDVFKTLMATRAYTVSMAHVEALNRIDLEFNGHDKREKAVVDAWLDILNNSDKMPLEQWDIKRVDLLVELLHKMAQVLDYDFNKTYIKNSSYSPRAHGDIEDEQRIIRKYLIELLEGRRRVPISVNNNEQ